MRAVAEPFRTNGQAWVTTTTVWHYPRWQKRNVGVDPHAACLVTECLAGNGATWPAWS